MTEDMDKLCTNNASTNVFNSFLEQQEAKVILPDEDRQRPFTEMEDIGAIGLFENFVPWEFCDEIVDSYEFWYNKKFILGEEAATNMNSKFKMQHMQDGEQQFEGHGGTLRRKDRALYLELADTNLACTVNNYIGQAFQIYQQKYPGILGDSADPVSSWTCKVQKTDPGGGYHQWHSENGCYMYRDRVLTWMLYLNDIPMTSGGATDFFHQKRSFQPKKGTIVLWPATFTHVHRGSFLTGDRSKYIATGWFSREPGQVTNRVIGEKMGKYTPTAREEFKGPPSLA